VICEGQWPIKSALWRLLVGGEVRAGGESIDGALLGGGGDVGKMQFGDYLFVNRLICHLCLRFHRDAQGRTLHRHLRCLTAFPTVLQ
jgi:hypothetical protein